MKTNVQATDMSNVKFEVKETKGAKSLVITIDLEQAKRVDLPLTSKGRSYSLATSNGFRLLENVPGFENVAFSVNTIVDKKAYEAYVAAQTAPAPATPVPATSVSTDATVMALQQMIQQQQAQMAQMMQTMQAMMAMQTK